MELARLLLLGYFVLFVVVLGACTIKWGTKWFWALKLWVRLVLMGSLLVSAGIGVAIQVKLAEQTEPVWLAQARVWPSMPRKVRWAWDLKNYSEPIRGAMKLWNSSVDCPLFVEAKDDEKEDVRVLFLEGTPCNADNVIRDKKDVAATYYCKDTADIDIIRLNEIREAYIIVAHEFGHVLGVGSPGTELEFAL